ncbi:hypothetical protein GJ496_006426 [Pomphorhynchus laevis]|nr:hypothetical protein GJ496_006426 [Pomphorhynchus laevis]
MLITPKLSSLASRSYMPSSLFLNTLAGETDGLSPDYLKDFVSFSGGMDGGIDHIRSDNEIRRLFYYRSGCYETRCPLLPAILVLPVFSKPTCPSRRGQRYHSDNFNSCRFSIPCLTHGSFEDRQQSTRWRCPRRSEKRFVHLLELCVSKYLGSKQPTLGCSWRWNCRK